ncbi:MAG: twin-arginine translocase TatA/TatE family subunit [Actinomycetota bacterium]|jgi:TatA/E family protein of Tat protein translocase
MFNLGPFELLAIFVVALLVFGPDKLPEMGRQVGKAVREFRKFQAHMESNVREVLDPITGPIVSNGPVGPPPTNVRDSGTVAAEAKANVPRSATIQSPEATEDEEAAAPGSYGFYAPVEPPAPAPQNGPAPAPDETAPQAPPAEEPPPERPTDPDHR